MDKNRWGPSINYRTRNVMMTVQTSLRDVDVREVHDDRTDILT